VVGGEWRELQRGAHGLYCAFYLEPCVLVFGSRLGQRICMLRGIRRLCLISLVVSYIFLMDRWIEGKKERKEFTNQK